MAASSSRMRAGRTMVRANGQRDGVGRTSLRAGASEHAQAIVDPTRVSPYRPAGRNIPAIHEAGHTTAPDRMHRTIRRRPQPRAQPTAAVNPLRGSSAPLRPLRGDRRGRPCGKLLSASRKAGRSSTEARTGFGSRSVVAAHRRSRTRGTRSRRKGLQSRRRPHTPARADGGVTGGNGGTDGDRSARITASDGLTGPSATRFAVRIALGRTFASSTTGHRRSPTMTQVEPSSRRAVSCGADS